MAQHHIRVSPALFAAATSISVELQKAIGLEENGTSLAAYLDGQARLQQIRAAQRTLDVEFSTARILELGSGMGMLVAVGRKLGLDITGSEPAANSYHSLRQATEALLQENGLPAEAINQSPGESLPWPDNSFDVVLSFQVLEHVKNPHRTLAEALRVLKPGGCLYFDMPNYHSMVEGHFGIAWFPFLAHSRPLARLYVRMMGRNPDFLNEINFVTRRRLRHWIKSLTTRYRITAEPVPAVGMEEDDIITDAPNIPAGRRFRGFSAKARSAIRRPYIKRLLATFGITEHLVLAAWK